MFRDEAGIWWLINIKTFKIKNIEKFKKIGETLSSPNLEYFINRRKGVGSGMGNKTRKFDYQTKLKCKFCGISYSVTKLKYNLTTKMIIETDVMLKHIGNQITFVDRPDLKHTDCSMIYLPYRVCEDCYLLFETMNDIKNCQIDIANFFRNPVDPVNFGLDYYSKKVDKNDKNIPEEVMQSKENKIPVKVEQNDHMDTNSNLKTFENTENSNSKKPKNCMYRIMIMFTDLFWNEQLTPLNEELFLLYNFLGNWYKVKIGKYYTELDYYNINFFKVYYIVCDEITGFVEYCDKNKQMEIKLGYFIDDEPKNDMQSKMPSKNISVEDSDICKNIEDFVEFASVEVSLQGLKYGEKYRNSLNGLLFKKEKPHYVGKLRCLIRISKENRDREDKSGKDSHKSFDITKYNLRKHFNLYIPPVHFVISDELQDYWLEIVERQKLRENILDIIFGTMKKNGIEYDKANHKEEIFKSLEALVSYYLNKNKSSE